MKLLDDGLYHGSSNRVLASDATIRAELFPKAPWFCASHSVMLNPGSKIFLPMEWRKNLGDFKHCALASSSKGHLVGCPCPSGSRFSGDFFEKSYKEPFADLQIVRTRITADGIELLIPPQKAGLVFDERRRGLLVGVTNRFEIWNPTKYAERERGPRANRDLLNQLMWG